mgnify:CR=1 FL=1
MLELAIFGATSVIGTIVWMVRLEGRVNQADTRIDGLKELINQRFDDLIENSNSRLDRIERSMNGHFAHKD